MTTTYTDLLRGIERTDDGVRVSVPDDWLQGRTAYGGLSAALALEAARGVAPDTPLRTAQVAFIGPAAGALTLRATVLRSGRSMTFVGVDAAGEAGACTRSLFGFGADRTSEIDYDDVPMPDVPPPGELPEWDFRARGGPAFLQHYEVRGAAGAMPFSGAAEARFLLWVRHREEAARAGEGPLLALADAPPPAFLSMLTSPAPTASVTWQADFLTDQHDSTDGWYLCGSTGDAAVNGYGGQSQMVWAADGEPVVAARQCCVVFG